MRILVIGALGTIGRSLVPELVKQGHQVSISSRDPNKESPWPELKLHRYTLDLLEPSSIAPALREIDVIYYLMHGMSDGEHHSPRELKAAHNLCQQARPFNIKHIIYMGSLLSKRPQSEHMRARRQTGGILRAGSIPVTELRAGIVVAPGSAAFEVMRDFVGHIPFAFVPSSIHKQMPPIAQQNLIHYLTELLRYPPQHHQVFDATGPEWLSYAQMMSQLANKLGKTCKLIVLPKLPLSWVSYALGLISSVPASLAKALVAGLSESLQADSKPLQHLIPQPLIAYEQAIDQVLAKEQITHYPKRWQDGVPQFRNFSPLHGFYAKSARHAIKCPVSAQQIWGIINLLGGKHRYFYCDSLWALREGLDALLGGPGRQHGRTNPHEFVVGDRVDSWEILSVEQERLLVLKFAMKAPGGGGMQISLEPLGQSECRLSIELFWHPAGFWGLVYWYFFAPWHQLLLEGMCSNICRLAQEK